MEEFPRTKDNGKVSRKALVAGILLCLLALYLIIGVVLVIVLVGDPPKGEKGFSYHFDLGNREPVISPGSEILIPAIVDRNNTLVFSESELNSIRVYGRYGLLYESAYPCDIRYTTTNNGTMISLTPHTISDPRYFSVDFYKKDYNGDTFLLSPVIKYDQQFLLNLYTFPVYIRNSTFSGRDPVHVDSMKMGLRVCGYDPRDPYVCKGFSSRPVTGHVMTGDLVRLTTNEFGEYNRYRHCVRLLTWPELFLNPEKCR